MEFILTCIIVLVLLKVVFKVSVSALKIVTAVFIGFLLLPLVPIGLAIVALIIPITIFAVLIGILGFIFKVIF